MANAAKRMLVRDVAVVLGFVAFVWVTMIFIMLSILASVGPSHNRNIIIAIGVVTLGFATLALLALILHLRNRPEVYEEELRIPAEGTENVEHDLPAEATPQQAAPHHAPTSVSVKVFDVMFIMALCFATLLATMLVRGKTVNDADIYRIGVPSALVTVVGFTVYFIYILINSHRELKDMVNEMYTDDEAA
jgi:hypothetical protein